jgi:hypothetical protein
MEGNEEESGPLLQEPATWTITATTIVGSATA